MGQADAGCGFSTLVMCGERFCDCVLSLGSEDGYVSLMCRNLAKMAVGTWSGFLVSVREMRNRFWAWATHERCCSGLKERYAFDGLCMAKEMTMISTSSRAPSVNESRNPYKQALQYSFIAKCNF